MKDKELLSIKRFSELTGVRQSKLRHYDKVKLFQPIKRGENGYRYYSALQTITVNCINVMHSLNIPIKKIMSFKNHKTPEQMLELFQKHEFELNKELFHLQQAYALVHTYSELIKEGLDADEHSISSRHVTASPIEIGPVNDFSDDNFYDSFFRFTKHMEERKIESVYPIGGIYDNMDMFINSPGRPTRFFSYVPMGRDVKAAGEFLIGYGRGYYGNLGDLPERLQEYATEHALVFSGPVYEMYIHDEISIDDPDRYLIKVSASLKKRKS